MIRVLLADDHAVVRAGLKEILSSTADIVLAGEATDGHQVLAAVRGNDYDVAVLDMTMPGRNGIELIKLVKAEQPELRILVLSMHSEAQYAVRAVKAGASGYLTKECAPEELVAAIRRIAGGGAVISAETAERLVLDTSARGAAAPHTLLSDREYQVFRMIAVGASISEIAAVLGLSVKTISTHKTRIFQKMGISNPSDLVRYALRHKLIDDSGSAGDEHNPRV